MEIGREDTDFLVSFATLDFMELKFDDKKASSLIIQ